MQCSSLSILRFDQVRTTQSMPKSKIIGALSPSHFLLFRGHGHETYNLEKIYIDGRVEHQFIILNSHTTFFIS